MEKFCLFPRIQCCYWFLFRQATPLVVNELNRLFWILALRLGFVFECAHADFTANNAFFRIIQRVPAYVVNCVLMNFEDEFSTTVGAFFPNNIVSSYSTFKLDIF